MSGLWDAVPQVRWSGNRLEPPIPATPAEPSVVANVATSDGLTVSDDEPVDPATVELAPTDTPAVPVPERGLPFERPTEAQAGIDVVAAEVPVEEPNSDEIERLKAALQDDVQRARIPVSPGGAHDVRMRVESMLAKSRRLFDLGQLREARHTAKVAQDLGDSAKLDYSPEEERPADLVQRIDDQLREAGQSPGPGAETVAALQTAPVTDAVDGSEPEVAPKRERGVNMFRRERPVPTNAESVEPETPAVELDLEFTSATQASDTAVVSANRSLSIAPQTDVVPARRAVIDESAPIAFDPASRFAPDPEASESRDEDASDPEEPPPLPESLPSWVGESPAEHQPLLDEVVPPPRDHDESSPVQFQSVGQVKSLNLKAPAQEPRSGSISQTIALVTLALCTGLALFWYRRGAT